MRDLAGELLGDSCKLMQADALSPENLGNAERIVLLWPDGNGYGWFWVERRTLAWKAGGTKVTVLNGRRRCFDLTMRVWSTYCFRRFLERFWVGELVFSLLFVMVSPLILAWDISRGRR